jgi:hypothetical protein
LQIFICKVIGIPIPVTDLHSQKAKEPKIKRYKVRNLATHPVRTGLL